MTIYNYALRSFIVYKDIIIDDYIKLFIVCIIDDLYICVCGGNMIDISLRKEYYIPQKTLTHTQRAAPEIF